MIYLKSIYQSILITSRIYYSKIFFSRINHRDKFLNNLALRNFKWDKEKGLKILAVMHVNNWETVLIDELKNLGEVSHFDWDAPKQFFESRDKWLAYYRKVNENLLDFIESKYNEKENFLVFIYASDFSIDTYVLSQIKKKNVIIISFCWDDLLYFEGKYKGQPLGVKELCQVADLNLTFSPESIFNYERLGVPCLFWDSEELDGSQYEEIDVGKISDSFYVLFVGSSYGRRGQFIDRLIKKGIPFKCFGAGWDAGSLTNSQMIEEIKKAPLTLGFSNIGYTEKHTTIKGRDFEVPLWGGLYLTQESKGLEYFYEIGKDLLVYRDLEDCVEKINLIKNNPTLALKIRQSGYSKAQKKATWKSRFKYLRKLIEV